MRPLAVAGVVFAAAVRAPYYRVSRSMTSSATSRAMVSVPSGSFIVPPFSGGTTPEHPEGEELR